MNIKLFSVRGDYTITKKRNGVIIQEERIHNLFTKGFIQRLIQNVNYFQYCQLGDSSTTPTSNDTSLGHLLWAVEKSSSVITETSTDGLTRVWTYVYVFPASSSYVGTIREVGLSGSSSGNLNTHALITDSEGQPISIEKTYLDEIIITAKISITRPSWTTGQTWTFASGPFSKSTLQGPILATYTSTTSEYQSILLSAQWCPEYRTVKNCRYTLLTTNLTYNNLTIYASAEFGSTAIFTGTTIFKDYINSLTLGSNVNMTVPPYRMLLPNEDIFPVATLQKLPLGTGDGIKTDFAPEVPVWLADTEVVYKNDVALTRGVDYLVDNLANLEKYQSVMLGNFVAEIKTKKLNGYPGYVWGAYERNEGYDVSSLSAVPVVYVNSPMVLKYAQDFAFTDKVNYYVLGSWTASESLSSGTALVFYYSIDNEETWTEFARITRTSSGTAFTDTTEHFLTTPITGITHVKIALENTTNTTAYVRHSNYDSRFGYVGQYAIRFTTPPASGDILKIDINIDRPWKSGDSVIQWNPVLTFEV